MLRVAFAMGGVGSARLVEGNAIAADIPRSRSVSCEGVGVSAVRAAAAAAGVDGIASVRADVATSIGSDRVRPDKASSAGEGKYDSAGVGG